MKNLIFIIGVILLTGCEKYELESPPKLTGGKWILTDYDVWERNPYYHGPEQQHPEDDTPSDEWKPYVAPQLPPPPGALPLEYGPAGQAVRCRLQGRPHARVGHRAAVRAAPGAWHPRRPCRRNPGP